MNRTLDTESINTPVTDYVDIVMSTTKSSSRESAESKGEADPVSVAKKFLISTAIKEMIEFNGVTQGLPKGYKQYYRRQLSDFRSKAPLYSYTLTELACAIVGLSDRPQTQAVLDHRVKRTWIRVESRLQEIFVEVQRGPTSERRELFQTSVEDEDVKVRTAAHWHKILNLVCHELDFAEQFNVWLGRGVWSSTLRPENLEFPPGPLEKAFVQSLHCFPWGSSKSRAPCPDIRSVEQISTHMTAVLHEIASRVEWIHISNAEGGRHAIGEYNEPSLNVINALHRLVDTLHDARSAKNLARGSSTSNGSGDESPTDRTSATTAAHTALKRKASLNPDQDDDDLRRTQRRYGGTEKTGDSPAEHWRTQVATTRLSP